MANTYPTHHQAGKVNTRLPGGPTSALHAALQDLPGPEHRIFPRCFFDPAEELGIFLDAEESSPAAEESSQTAVQEFRDGFVEGLSAEGVVESASPGGISGEEDDASDNGTASVFSSMMTERQRTMIATR